MANFEAYQEYQRIEDFEEDSPPGEEDLLVHVPEGLKGKHVTNKNDLMYIRTTTRKSNQMCPVGRTGFALLLSNVIFCVADSWHHIKNLDNFFTRISFNPNTACLSFLLIET